MAATQDPRVSDRATVDILLVDDAESLRTLYRTILESDDRFAVVGEAPDGRTAIDQAGRLQPDLVLLDLSMPDMDGLEALPRILDVAPDSTVVVLSGFLEERFGDEARTLGAAGYIEKGASPDEIVDEIVEILGPDALPEPPPQATPDPAPSRSLREPLRDVQEQIDRVVDRWDPDANGHLDEPLRDALEGTRRMEAILDGLLTYGQLGDDTDTTRPVALDEALDAAVASLQDRIEATGAEIVRDDLPVVDAHPGDLARLLEELIDNAITFHDGAPTIEVTAKIQDDTCEVVVADDGPGIDPARRDDALELFWTSLDDPDHHGLGLAICRRIVGRHGGQLRIADDADGTTIRFDLEPAHEEGS